MGGNRRVTIRRQNSARREVIHGVPNCLYWLQPTVDRFRAIQDSEDKKSFKEKLGGFVRLYAFLAQIIPYADAKLEMLFSFVRALFRTMA